MLIARSFCFETNSQYVADGDEDWNGDEDMDKWNGWCSNEIVLWAESPMAELTALAEKAMAQDSKEKDGAQSGGARMR